MNDFIFKYFCKYAACVAILAFHRYAYCGINIQSQSPAAGSKFIFLESAQTDIAIGRMRKVQSYFINAQYNYIDQPLVEMFPNGSISPIILDLQSLELRPGFLLLDNLQTSFHISLNSLQRSNGNSIWDWADSTLQVKYRLSKENSFLNYAIISELSLPTGSEEHFLSTGRLGATLKGALDYDIEPFAFGINLGYRHSPNAIWKTIDYSKQIYIGLAASYRAAQDLFLNLEASGYYSIPFEENNSPGEYYLGGAWALNSYSLFTAGLSVSGLQRESHSNQSLRSIVGIKFYSDPGPKALSCTTSQTSLTSFARPLTNDEETLFYDLPYLHKQQLAPTIKNKISTLKLGQMTGLASNGIPFVRDSQIPFAIDIKNLPPRLSLKSMDQALLKMTVNKISQDPYLTTEVLCLLKQKKCSGQMIQDKLWHQHINTSFLDSNRNTLNSVFSNQYLDKPVATIEGNKIYSSQITLSLFDLIQNSELKIEDIIYPENAESSSQFSGTLYFAIADDTFVHNDGRLELSLTTEVCQ